MVGFKGKNSCWERLLLVDLRGSRVSTAGVSNCEGASRWLDVGQSLPFRQVDAP